RGGDVRSHVLPGRLLRARRRDLRFGPIRRLSGPFRIAPLELARFAPAICEQSRSADRLSGRSQVPDRGRTGRAVQRAVPGARHRRRAGHLRGWMGPGARFQYTAGPGAALRGEDGGRAAPDPGPVPRGARGVPRGALAGLRLSGKPCQGLLLTLCGAFPTLRGVTQRHPREMTESAWGWTE